MGLLTEGFELAFITIDRPDNDFEAKNPFEPLLWPILSWRQGD
jgi:hypothetical protein